MVMKTCKLVKHWRFVGFLILAVLAVQLPASAQARNNPAPLQYPQPSGVGLFVYVPEYWQNPNTFNGVTKTLAYQRGYQAPYTASSPNIILDFGRQLLAPSGNWAVVLTPNGPKHSMLWARNIAQDFIDGYDANPYHQSGYVAIGTNNGDFDWYCLNTDPANLSSLWRIAGDQWGQLVKGLTPRPHVTVKSANDIEVFDEIDPARLWKACGIGALAWFDGYEGQTSIANYDFGDNAWDRPGNQWTEDNIQKVVWGRSTAYSLPQVYCSGSHWATSWEPVRRDYYISFLGVTSTDGGQGPPGCDNLPWQTSWNNLNDALTYPNSSIGYPGYSDTVLSNAAVWWQKP